jgi:hypothetical protein
MHLPYYLSFINLTFVRILLSRKEIKIVLCTTAAGGILQIISRQYIKNHPESFEEKNTEPGMDTPLLVIAAPVSVLLAASWALFNLKNKNKLKTKNRTHRFPRGGTWVQVFTITSRVLVFLSDHGLLAGFLTGSGVVLSQIPTSAISRYLSDASPQNLPELDRKKFLLVDGEKICLDQCDRSLDLHYLFGILADPQIPFEEREDQALSMFIKYLNLKTADRRLKFVICLVFMLSIFSIHNMSAYHILLKTLIKAIKEGRISKVVGRAIIRQLRKKGLSVTPELLEVVNFKK